MAMTPEQIAAALNIGVAHASDADLRNWFTEAKRIVELADAVAGQLDPKLRRKSTLANKFDSLAHHARGIVLSLTLHFEAQQSAQTSPAGAELPAGQAGAEATR